MDKTRLQVGIYQLCDAVMALADALRWIDDIDGQAKLSLERAMGRVQDAQDNLSLALDENPPNDSS